MKLNCKIYGINGAYYSPLERMLGLTIAELAERGVRTEHIISAEGELDVSSPETYLASFRAIYDKLEVPESWEAMPMDVGYGLGDPFDVETGVGVQGCFVRDGGESWETFKEKDTEKAPPFFSQLQAMANGVSAEEAMNDRLAEIGMLEEEATL